MRWKSEKQQLEDLIKEGKSYEEIGRMYGCTGSNIKKVAKRLGIALEPRRTINDKETFNRGTAKTELCEYCGKEYVVYKGHCGHYCSLQCMGLAQKQRIIEDWKAGKISGHNARFRLLNTIREYMLEKNEYKCEVCGFSGVNPYTNKTILQVHHKNGDASDTHEDNLQVLCPNCHAMTENFGSRNKSSIRKYRKEEYVKSEMKAKKARLV